MKNYFSMSLTQNYGMALENWEKLFNNIVVILLINNVVVFFFLRIFTVLICTQLIECETLVFQLQCCDHVKWVSKVSRSSQYNLT